MNNMLICAQTGTTTLNVPKVEYHINNLTVNNIVKAGEKMCNKDIREYAKKKGVRLWQIANELHVNEGNFSRKLRHELQEEKKQQIYKIIDELAESSN